MIEVRLPSRPRISDGDRVSINIYLTSDQKARLLRIARESKISPSSVIRKWIDEREFI